LISVLGSPFILSITQLEGNEISKVYMNFAGKIYEIGASGISSLRGHSPRRNRCLNDLISLYKTSPLVLTNVKAVSARNEWLW